MVDTSKVYRDAAQDISKMNNCVIVVYNVKKNKKICLIYKVFLENTCSSVRIQVCIVQGNQGEVIKGL